MSRTERSTGANRALVPVVCLALATVVSAMASLNVALPSIARDTHATQTQLAWIIDAYSLVFAALLLPAGALGDRYGRRRALLAGLLVFGVGSGLAMTVTSAPMLIVLRGVLGVGAALVMPATLSTITSSVPTERRAKAVGLWAGVAGASAVVGLLASGSLLQAWSWRSVFALNVVLALVAIAGTLRFVPESADPAAPRIDIGGALIAVAGLVALVYSVIEAPDTGWVAARTLAGIACGIGLLVAFVFFELRQAAPMLDPRLFRNRSFAAGSLSILVQFFAFFGFVFIALQYLQIVRGDSALLAAVSVLPMAAAMMPTARTAPAIMARIGAARTSVIGLVLISVALVVLSQVGTDSSYWLFVAGLLPLGVGMGLATTPATTAITSALPQSQQGVGSAMNDLSRELGGALGIAIVGSVLTAGYRSHLHLVGVPPAVADKARGSLAVAAHLGSNVVGQARAAFVEGIHGALLVGSGSALVVAVCVAVLLRTKGAAVAGELEERPVGAPMSLLNR
jgi:EmrB/QacA subfamily drug resistance transporter